MSVSSLTGDLFGSLAEGGGIYLCTVAAVLPVDMTQRDREIYRIQLKIQHVYTTAKGLTAEVGGILTLPYVVLLPGMRSDYAETVWPLGDITRKTLLCVVCKNGVDNLVSDLKGVDGAATTVYDITEANKAILDDITTICAIHREQDAMAQYQLIHAAEKLNRPLITQYLVKKTARGLSNTDPLYWTKVSLSFLSQLLANLDRQQVGIISIGKYYREFDLMCDLTESSAEKDTLILRTLADRILQGSPVSRSAACDTLGSILSRSKLEHGRSRFYSHRIFSAQEIGDLQKAIEKTMSDSNDTIVQWLNN